MLPLTNFFYLVYVLLNVIGCFTPFVDLMAKKIPKSSYLAKKNLGLQNEYTKFVVCPKCWELYLYEDAMIKNGSQQTSKRCTFIEYPHHSIKSRRARCNACLLKTVELASTGKKKLYPYKIYCYKSLQSILQDFLLRPDFSQECEHWRSRPPSNSLYRDIYDGEVWKYFQEVGGVPFLSSPFTLALMLNVDWFQPFSHTVWSVGLVYLTIMNLPRQKRYKRKNMILIGVIPGPSEPLHDINSILQPLVIELKKFWRGIALQVSTKDGMQERTIRCALLCVACDLPAGRKVCGFLSHSAAKGCSKCRKKFPGTVGCMCYSGFDRSLWPPRITEVMSKKYKIVILRLLEH